MLSNSKKIIEKPLGRIAEHLSFVNPNVLTLLGIIPSIVFFICMLNHQYLFALIALVGNVFDLLDGAVARINQRATAFGGFLDSTLDRIADFIMISAFAFAGLVRWEIIAPVLLSSFLISYTRSRGELASGKKISFAVGIVERTERLIFLFIAVLFLIMLKNKQLLESIFFLLLALSFITFFQRCWHAYKKL